MEHIPHNRIPSRASDVANGDPEVRPAGLRVRPTTPGPNGAFVVVEMTILVIVAALAMVSLIVSSGEGTTDGRGPSRLEARRATPAITSGDVLDARAARLRDRRAGEVDADVAIR